MLGTVLGQYRVTGSIGRGGMGVVYQAKHVLLDRPAAVKVLAPELSRNEDMVTRFFNEARAATAIRHPGIVEIYDFGYSEDSAAYIAMELLEGESLAARMHKVRIPAPNMLVIARQIAGALGAAHAKGIIHRDLKPDNVFLVPDPEVPGGERIKLLDFGIAKLVAEQGQGQTRTGAILGTPAYMAPEQCRGVAVDFRADLYSVGCIIFEILAGRPPFVGEGAGDVLAAHIAAPPPLVATFVPDVPAPLEALVQGLLVKDPKARTQSARELVAAIDAILPDRSFGTGRDWSTPALTPPPTGTEATVASTPGAVTPPPPSRTPLPSSTPLPSNTPLPSSTPVSTLAAATSSGTRPPVAPSHKGTLFAALVAAVVIAGGVFFALHGGGNAPAAASSPPPAAAPAARPTVQPIETPSAPPIATAPTPTPPPPPPVGSAAIAAPPPTIAVAIDSAPAGAEVVLDGRVVGKTPYAGTLPRESTSRSLVVRLAGYDDRVVKIDTTTDAAETVTLEKKHARTSTQPKKPSANHDQSFNPFD